MLIESILDSPQTISLETRCFGEDLARLLAKKKLRNYAGMSPFNDLHAINQYPSSLFFDSSSAQYRGDFLGFTETLKDFPKFALPSQSVFFTKRKSFFKFDVEPELTNISESLFLENT